MQTQTNPATQIRKHHLPTAVIRRDGQRAAFEIRRLIADDSLGAVQLVGPLKVKDQPLSSRIVFTFDGDAAGQKAALHAFGLDSAFLSQTFVAVADDNLDPCDLRMEQGEAAVRELVGRRIPLYRFVMSNIAKSYDLDRADGRLAAAREGAALVGAEVFGRGLHGER